MKQKIKDTIIGVVWCFAVLAIFVGVIISFRDELHFKESVILKLSELERKTIIVYRDQPSNQTIEINTPRGSIQYQPCQKHIFVEFNDSVKRDRYLTLVDSAKLVLGKNSEVFATDDAVEGIILESGEEFGCKYVSVNIEK